MLAERAFNKGLELVAEIPPQMRASLRGDPGRLRQILTNLVGNAIKFTEEGEVVVRVGKEAETETHVVIRFDVHDTGIALIPQLQAAAKAGQAEKVERLAHRLVGANANCGIISVVTPLRELERMGRSHQLDGAERLSTAVNDQFKLVEQFLTSLLSEGDDSGRWSGLAE
jgi:hypothetical protein